MPQKKSAKKVAQRAGDSKKSPNHSGRQVVFAKQAITSRLEMLSPAYTAAKGGGIRVRHKEFLADVNRYVNFTVPFYQNINPGNQNLFPWLSSISRSFEMYKIHSLRVRYETDLSTGSVGAIYMAADLDPSDNLPTNKNDFMSLVGAVRTAVWDTIALDVVKINRPHFQKTRYIRRQGSLPLPEETSVIDFDAGTFFYGASGAPADNQNTGELYIEYDIELITPSAPLPFSDTTIIDSDGFSTPFGKVFGTTNVIQGSIPVSVLPSSNQLTILPAGTFLVMYYVDGVIGAYDIVPTVTVTAGVTVLWQFDTILSNVSPYRFAYTVILTCPKSNCVLTVDFSTAITSEPSNTSTMVVSYDGRYVPNFELSKVKEQIDEFVVVTQGKPGRPLEKQAALQVSQRRP